MTTVEALRTLASACRHLALAVPDKRLRVELERAVRLAERTADEASTVSVPGESADFDRGWHQGAALELETAAEELINLSTATLPPQVGASLERSRLEGYSQGMYRAGQMLQRRALLLKAN